MSTHKIGFYEDMKKIIFELSSNTHLISSADLPTTSSLISFQKKSGPCSCVIVIANLLCIPWCNIYVPVHGISSLWSTTAGTYLRNQDRDVSSVLFYEKCSNTCSSNT